MKWAGFAFLAMLLLPVGALGAKKTLSVWAEDGDRHYACELARDHVKSLCLKQGGRNSTPEGCRECLSLGDKFRCHYYVTCVLENE
jgi:hypothetical protein